MKSILFILTLLFSLTLYSQEYEYGLIKQIESKENKVTITIDKVQVYFDDDGKMHVINNNKAVYKYSVVKQTEIKDCLYSSNPSNIYNFKDKLKDQFVLFKSTTYSELRELNINCYN